MTTVKYLKAKAKVSFISMMTLSLLMSCSETKKDGSGKIEETDAIEEKTVKAPSVDIHTATFFANHEAVKQHIEAGTDLNQKDQFGSTSLHVAVTFGRKDIAMSLIDADADLSVKNPQGSTPLHVASFFCRTEIVKALLAKGADKSIQDNYGSTPYASVAGPFNDVKPVYDQMTKDLGALGLKLDYKHLEETRPVIAELLK